MEGADEIPLLVQKTVMVESDLGELSTETAMGASLKNK